MKIQMVGVLAVAVCAFLALTATSAFAENHEWLVGDLSIPAGEEVGVKFAIELLLEEMKERLDIICSEVLGGFVLPGGLGSITLIEDLKSGNTISLANELNLVTGFISCLVREAGSCEWAKEQEIKVFPIHFPWATDLSLVTNLGGEPEWVALFKSGGNGEPGYEVPCVKFKIESFGTCIGETGALLNNGALDVSAEFDETDTTITQAAECTLPLGKGEGLLSGSGLIETTIGLSLEVS